MDRQGDTPLSLVEWVEFAEAHLSQSGSFFMPTEGTTISGQAVLAELKKRHPTSQIGGVVIGFEQVYAIWSDLKTGVIVEIARRLQRFSRDIEADLQLTGHHVVAADINDLVYAALEYLRKRYRYSRIQLVGSDGIFVVMSDGPFRDIERRECGP